MRVRDRRILAAGRRHEAIAEAQLEHPPGRLVAVDVDAPPLGEEQAAQVVDAVGVVGMLMGIEHAVDPVDAGVEELLAQVRRGVDEDAGGALSLPPVAVSSCAVRSTRIEQRRRRFFGVFRVATAPAEPGRGTPPEKPQPRMVTEKLMPRRPSSAALC